MFQVGREEFEKIIEKAVAGLPSIYVEHLNNIAFLVEDDPSPSQRQSLALRHDQSLFGLYEGVPLPKRLGTTKLLPDKITLFQNPLQQTSSNLSELRNRISRTVWHEVAHYYGLDHKRIYELESQEHLSSEE